MSVFTYALKKHVRMFNKHLGEYNSYYIIKKNGIFLLDAKIVKFVYLDFVVHTTQSSHSM